MTAPDVVSIIAAALAEHWTFSTDTDDYPRFVDRCDGCHEVVFNHGRENNQNQSYAAHQARAVLAALGDVLGVEWGMRTPLGMHYDYASEEEARRLAGQNRCDVVTRLSAGPWTAVEG